MSSKISKVLAALALVTFAHLSDASDLEYDYFDNPAANLTEAAYLQALEIHPEVCAELVKKSPEELQAMITASIASAAAAKEKYEAASALNVTAAAAAEEAELAAIAANEAAVKAAADNSTDAQTAAVEAAAATEAAHAARRESDEKFYAASMAGIEATVAASLASQSPMIAENCRLNATSVVTSDSFFSQLVTSARNLILFIQELAMRFINSVTAFFGGEVEGAEMERTSQLSFAQVKQRVEELVLMAELGRLVTKEAALRYAQRAFSAMWSFVQ